MQQNLLALPTPLSDAEVKIRVEFVLRTLSDYSVISVIGLARNALDIPRLERLPWITLLLVQLAFRSKQNTLVRGPPMPLATFSALCNELWHITGDSALDGPSLHASLRAYLPVQLEFQVSRPSSIIRWPMLVDRLPEAHSAKRMFAEEFQLTPTQYMDAAHVLLLHLDLPNSNRNIQKAFIEHLPEELRAPTHRIIALISKDLLALRTELQAETGVDLPERWELNQLPFAARFPLFEVESGDYYIWHPSMLKRALEELPHRQLMRRDDEYLRVYSRLFEDYVTELVQKICPNLITENQWKKKMGHNAPAVEAIMPFDGVNIFIEAKMGANCDGTIFINDHARIANRLYGVIKALDQARKVSQRLRREAYKYPKRAQSSEEFLIIVTSRELYVRNGSRLEELLPPGTLDFDDAGVNQRMPLSNVFVVSIDDFERLQATVRNGKVDLLHFLREMVAQNTNTAPAGSFLSAQLRKTIGQAPDFSTLIDETYKTSWERVSSLLPSPDKSGITRRGKSAKKSRKRQRA